MSTTVQGWTREQIARRAAQDIAEGSYVNLGIGMPELIAQFIPTGREIVLHTENGLLGMGPSPTPGAADPRAYQCRQTTDHRTTGRLLLPPGRQLRHDQRRSP